MPALVRQDDFVAVNIFFTDKGDNESITRRAVSRMFRRRSIRTLEIFTVMRNGESETDFTIALKI